MYPNEFLFRSKSICFGYSKVSLSSPRNACFELVIYKENVRRKQNGLVEHNLLEVVAFRSSKNLRQDINYMKIRLLKYRKYGTYELNILISLTFALPINMRLRSHSTIRQFQFKSFRYRPLQMFLFVCFRLSSILQSYHNSLLSLTVPGQASHTLSSVTDNCPSEISNL